MEKKNLTPEESTRETTSSINSDSLKNAQIPDDLPVTDFDDKANLAKLLSSDINHIAEKLIKFQKDTLAESPDDWQYFERCFIYTSHAFNIMCDYFGQLSYLQYNLKNIKQANEKSIEKEFQS